MARIFVLGVMATCAVAQDLAADLDYGTFVGAYSQQYNISYWQKIPFAAPPVGQNRFRGPQPPAPITDGPYNSSQTFDMCPQRTVGDHLPSSYIRYHDIEAYIVTYRSMALKIACIWAYTVAPGQLGSPYGQSW